MRGVSQVARVKAAQAAAHRRVTIGDWVNHAIITYAYREAGIETLQPAAADAAADETDNAMRLVETLACHIDETGAAMNSPRDLSHEVRPPGTPPVTPPVAPPVTPPVAPPVAPASPITTLNTAAPEQPVPNPAPGALSVFAKRLKLTGGAAAAGEARPAQARPPAPHAPHAPHARPTEAASSPAATAANQMSETELAFWDTIKDSNSPDDYQIYLETYPNGVFAPIARSRTAPGPQSGNATTEQRPPPTAHPKLNFNTLNQRAIENTRRLHPDKK